MATETKKRAGRGWWAWAFFVTALSFSEGGRRGRRLFCAAWGFSQDSGLHISRIFGNFAAKF